MLSKVGREAAIIAGWLAGVLPSVATEQPEKLDVLGIQITIKVDGEKTGGAMSVIEGLVPPGGGPPMHIHSREDELFHVIEGRFRFWHGDHVMELEPGAVVFLPRSGRHTYQNIGATPGRLFTVITPAGFEGFFREVAKRGLSVPKDMPELTAIAQQYGLQFVGPPPRTSN